jgi:hypothetical protein
VKGFGLGNSEKRPEFLRQSEQALSTITKAEKALGDETPSDVQSFIVNLKKLRQDVSASIVSEAKAKSEAERLVNLIKEEWGDNLEGIVCAYYCSTRFQRSPLIRTILQ